MFVLIANRRCGKRLHTASVQCQMTGIFFIIIPLNYFFANTFFVFCSYF